MMDGSGIEAKVRGGVDQFTGIAFMTWIFL